MPEALEVYDPSYSPSISSLNLTGFKESAPWLTLHSYSVWSAGEWAGWNYIKQAYVAARGSTDEMLHTWTFHPGLWGHLSWLCSCPCPSPFPFPASSFPSRPSSRGLSVCHLYKGGRWPRDPRWGRHCWTSTLDRIWSFPPCPLPLAQLEKWKDQNGHQQKGHLSTQGRKDEKMVRHLLSYSETCCAVTPPFNLFRKEKLL